MSITLTKVNNRVVGAIPLGKVDNRPVKGGEIIKECYANLFACAKKNSGKTSSIFYIMKHCAVKSTKIIVFCSTLDKDPNWLQIRKYFEGKGMDFEGHTSIIDEDTGEDRVALLVHELTEKAKVEKEQDEEPIDECELIFKELHKCNNNLFSYIQQPEKEEKPKKKKSKWQAPEFIIVFDDLSHQLKSKSLVKLLKENRHFRMKIIISSQYLHDLLPESRKMLDVVMLFKGLPEEKLMHIYKDTDISISFTLFDKLYKRATKYKYSFFFIDTRNDIFRRCFHEQFIFKEPDDIKYASKMSEIEDQFDTT